ncbi:hypothetical protein GSI_11566 [Ganoderma sinense ZZ0214-1]|uniref:Uncharacterized protein n=1 Tax=Ganoderma sinense ZZ0214-1 TaxID=1077348 RepID=A0A2G8RWC3_9APHY|nr:hypothetical protein GSI_11566 [Ganoderma sinense ZZ0214-1]
MALVAAWQTVSEKTRRNGRLKDEFCQGRSVQEHGCSSQAARDKPHLPRYEERNPPTTLEATLADPRTKSKLVGVLSAQILAPAGIDSIAIAEPQRSRVEVGILDVAAPLQRKARPKAESMDDAHTVIAYTYTVRAAPPRSHGSGWRCLEGDSAVEQSTQRLGLDNDRKDS